MGAALIEQKENNPMTDKDKTNHAEWKPPLGEIFNQAGRLVPAAAPQP
jgi:hypothetical protein